MQEKEFLEKLQQRAAAQKVAEGFGIVLEEVGPGYAKASRVCREDMAKSWG
ncbi:MAG: hypothetical protein JRI59_06300 [Deltaproteobacteria bacterium]|nr:hypothetical protein [Deltaproteobacteria bacterium]